MSHADPPFFRAGRERHISPLQAVGGAMADASLTSMPADGAAVILGATGGLGVAVLHRLCFV